ncbi:MAG: aldo/keto reductase [Ruminococcaceae bacterium]|nr:aldo/keto reductase [Oscillospiraceae bacterium]
MDYRVLGKTGLQVSRMGFGGLPIQRTDDAACREILVKLAELGVNYIDTARGYTVSEEYIGKSLAGMRDKFILATKSMAKDKESMARDIETSLRNLQTDYIDIYQIHNPNREGYDQIVAPGGALEALLEAKAAGKIGHIGFTNHYAEMIELVLQEDWVETVMFPYNIVETQGEKLLALCKEKNVGFIAMKPLAGGAIEDATIALRYVAASEGVDVIIPGMDYPAQVKENHDAIVNTAPLSKEEQEKISAIRKDLGENFCRRCNYCAPCTVGIKIPTVFLFDGYLTRYGLPDWAKSRYEALEKHASDCIVCGDCEKRCPYHLPIRDMLLKVAERFGK